MRKLLISLLREPIMRINNKFSSNPDKTKIYNALSKLFNNIIEDPGNKGLQIEFDNLKDKFIIFSDQHKGRRNGADDFTHSAANYIEALKFYNSRNFSFINLGDCEELWENHSLQIVEPNKEVFEAEKLFLHRNSFIKIFGNHDLYWTTSPLAKLELINIFGAEIKIYEGVILTTAIGDKKLHIFCTHGHQGDEKSDGNKLVKFFIANIWAPLQAYLKINPNEPSTNSFKKTIHNEIMYEWSATQKGTVLVTGHTHQPVFESLTHLEKLYRNMQIAQKNHDEILFADYDKQVRALERDFTLVTTDYLTTSPSYFNTGCCCFADGDITGIELEDGMIRLIKWEYDASRLSVRSVLDEKKLQELF